jgi:hypothetical protein
LKRPGGPGAAPAAAPTIPLRPSGPGPAATTALKPTPGSPGAAPTQVLPQATTKLRQTQPLGQLPPPSAPISVAPKAANAEDTAEESDTMNIILAALVLLTTIFLGTLQYAKSRVADVKDADIQAVKAESSFIDLLSK